LDLLTEARSVRQFPRLRTDLGALYAGYYIAELLSDWTEDYDPHQVLYDETMSVLEGMGDRSAVEITTGLRLARFECVLLRELGYSPNLESCAVCGGPVGETGLGFSPAAGGVVCGNCRKVRRDCRPLPGEVKQALTVLRDQQGSWNRAWTPGARSELRQLLSQYVTYLLGRQPRLLPYLGS
jgi:DNA repair protein RecO (recombination protein O)